MKSEDLYLNRENMTYTWFVGHKVWEKEGCPQSKVTEHLPKEIGMVNIGDPIIIHCGAFHEGFYIGIDKNSVAIQLFDNSANYHLPLTSFEKFFIPIEKPNFIK